MTIYNVSLIGTVPEYTKFDRDGSDPRWVIPGYLQRSIQSDHCPAGHEAQKRCAISLSDMEPKQSVSGILFAVQVDRALVGDATRLLFSAKLAGYDSLNSEKEFSVEADANITTTIPSMPTAMDPIAEPQSNKLYLPLISR